MAISVPDRRMYIRNIKEAKLHLRAKHRRFRERMSEDQKRKLDAAITSKVLGLREYAQAETIFTYVSKSIEVDTVGLIRAAFLNRKKVAVPRCVPGTREMEFYYINSMEELKPGAFGVLEPEPLEENLAVGGEKDLCIVPGLAFDPEGFRLGYGKGYYDRFLSSFQGETVGICYLGCVQWNLPHGYYDRPVDILITERYVRNIQRPKRQEES